MAAARSLIYLWIMRPSESINGKRAGFFLFWNRCPEEVLSIRIIISLRPPRRLTGYKEVSEIDFPHFVSWADVERDLSAWLSNSLQKDAIEKIYSLEKEVKAAGDKELLEDWRRLLVSDHFYYMCTKFFADGDVHKYFNPYDSPYEAFIAYMNVMKDLKIRIEEKNKMMEEEIGNRKRGRSFGRAKAAITAIISGRGKTIL
jgi:alpha-amylase